MKISTGDTTPSAEEKITKTGVTDMAISQAAHKHEYFIDFFIGEGNNIDVTRRSSALVSPTNRWRTLG